jgi:hypothetical protein
VRRNLKTKILIFANHGNLGLRWCTKANSAPLTYGAHTGCNPKENKPVPIMLVEAEAVATIPNDKKPPEPIVPHSRELTIIINRN